MMRIRIPPTMKAATTAIRGNNISRRRFISFLSFVLCTLFFVPGIKMALRKHKSFPAEHAKYKDQRTKFQ
jgi:hypothetical protein